MESRRRFWARIMPTARAQVDRALAPQVEEPEYSVKQTTCDAARIVKPRVRAKFTMKNGTLSDLMRGALCTDGYPINSRFLNHSEST